MEIIADYDYINGKKHSEANEANVCPQCDKFKSESKASRNDHYVRVGWNVYFYQMRFPKMYVYKLGRVRQLIFPIAIRHEKSINIPSDSASLRHLLFNGSRIAIYWGLAESEPGPCEIGWAIWKPILYMACGPYVHHRRTSLSTLQWFEKPYWKTTAAEAYANGEKLCK